MYENTATAVKEENKMGYKLAAWAINLLDALGITTAVLAFVANIDTWESIILFSLSIIFFGYRIASLNEDIKKKKIENEERRYNLNVKKSKNTIPKQ